VFQHHGRMEPVIIESCNSTWVFNLDHRRFRRILKGLQLQNRFAVTHWRPFYRLELKPDSEAFTVLLNASGTRLIRSWRHTSPCTQCGNNATVELSLEELRSAIENDTDAIGDLRFLHSS
jgi:hypothetical protein